MARTEVRKECPSCGLGVPLDAKVCEFCGWDFEEEDEWISQIEQLEQELMSEKQKSDAGKVDRMIKSTLRSPVREKPPEKTAEGKKPIAVTIKKKVPSRPEEEPEETEIPPEEQVGEPDSITVSTSRPEPSSKSAISIKVGAKKEEIPPPPEEIEAQKAPVAAAPKPVSGSGKKVRRVVKGHRPMVSAPGAKPVSQSAQSASKPIPTKPSVQATQSTSKPAPTPQAKPETPPAKPASTQAAKPTTAQTAPAKPKEEKKGFFGGLGKMFSMESGKKEPKPEDRKKPDEKQIPQKGETLGASEKKTPLAEEKAVRTVRVFICPLCNAEVEETEKACPKCGAEFE